MESKLAGEQLAVHIAAHSQSVYDEVKEQDFNDGGGATTKRKPVAIELRETNGNNDYDLQDDQDMDKKPAKQQHGAEDKRKQNDDGCFTFDYLKLSGFACLDTFKKALAIADAVTDIKLLIIAAQRAADGGEDSTKMLMILLFLSIMSPYILSYSSGIAMFLYHRTFNGISALSIKSLLLTLYIFPTGCLYFIAIDISDALLSVYKLLAYVVGRKSEGEVIKAESRFVAYFGMSEMVCYPVLLSNSQSLQKIKKRF